MTDLKQIKEQMRREHRRLKFRKFLHNRAVLIGTAVTVIMIILALTAHVISPYDPQACLLYTSPSPRDCS